MTTSKQDFVKTFCPDTVRDINFAQIDLDITDLSLADILRNANKAFPNNSRLRNSIISGQYAIGILCKSELLYPISGILLIICGEDTEFEILSKNYIVVGVRESMIKTDESVKEVIDGITKYIITEFRDSIEKFHEFYAKFVYDEYEMEMENESLEDYYRNF